MTSSWGYTMNRLMFFLCLLPVFFGCMEHSMPRDAGDMHPPDTSFLHGLDSSSRAAVKAMRSYFKTIDSSMNAHPASTDSLLP